MTLKKMRPLGVTSKPLGSVPSVLFSSEMIELLPKILLVDDDALNRRLYRRILAPLSAEVVEAASGAEALIAAQENDFAVVVLDCEMPVMDGFETARQLRTLRRAELVPIIFFTAEFTSAQQRREGHEIGAVDYLLKSPESSALLLQKIQVFLDLEMDHIRLRSELNKAKEHASLQEANTLATIATESCEIGIWDYDIPSGILSWNPVMYQLHGIAPGDDVAANSEVWRRHLHPNDVEVAEQALQACIDGIGPFDITYRIVRDDDSVRHLRTTGQVKRDDAGSAVRIVGASSDVTDLVEAKRDLSRKCTSLKRPAD
jgi:CheY-like chemotaxis protein